MTCVHYYALVMGLTCVGSSNNTNTYFFSLALASVAGTSFSRLCIGYPLFHRHFHYILTLYQLPVHIFEDKLLSSSTFNGVAAGLWYRKRLSVEFVGDREDLTRDSAGVSLNERIRSPLVPMEKIRRR